MPEMVLDKFQGHAVIEQVRGDGMPKAVAGKRGRQAGKVAVVFEARLDLALLERPGAPGEEREAQLPASERQVLAKEIDQRAEDRSLTPGPAFQAADEHPTALEVHVPDPQQRDLPDPKAVEVDQPEEQLVTARRNRGEEARDFGLGEVARQALRRPEDIGHKRGGYGYTYGLTAPFSENVQSGRFEAAGAAPVNSP